MLDAVQAWHAIVYVIGVITWSTPSYSAIRTAACCVSALRNSPSSSCSRVRPAPSLLIAQSWLRDAWLLLGC